MNLISHVAPKLAHDEVEAAVAGRQGRRRGRASLREAVRAEHEGLAELVQTLRDTVDDLEERLGGDAARGRRA